jgi:hypothetical protein
LLYKGNLSDFSQALKWYLAAGPALLGVGLYAQGSIFESRLCPYPDSC